MKNRLNQHPSQPVSGTDSSPEGHHKQYQGNQHLNPSLLVLEGLEHQWRLYQGNHQQANLSLPILEGLELQLMLFQVLLEEEEEADPGYK